jgi:glycosyltransferase involved in cell wall biosynthesis
MISILIPVFNVDVQELIQELSSQLDNLSIEGEILVYDDWSEPFFRQKNETIGSIKNVVYKELDKNYGRVGIRQLLASHAQYEWLLFVDSDSVIISSSYLRNYIESIEVQYDVYTGGRVYESKMPVDCSKRLHWKYGTQRESVKGSSKALHTNNFCIRKTLFLELDFPPYLRGYGHEDTWIQIQLEKAKHKIRFLCNPVLHAGLETSAAFLEKTKNALKNLIELADDEKPEIVKRKVVLYRLFLSLQKFGLVSPAKKILHKRIGKIEMNLRSCHPLLFQFDLYRLYYLLKS